MASAGDSFVIVRRARLRNGMGTKQLKERPSGLEKRADSNGTCRANGSPKKSWRGASTEGQSCPSQ